jgi:hypothetical protein
MRLAEREFFSSAGKPAAAMIRRGLVLWDLRSLLAVSR